MNYPEYLIHFILQSLIKTKAAKVCRPSFSMLHLICKVILKGMRHLHYRFQKNLHNKHSTDSKLACRGQWQMCKQFCVRVLHKNFTLELNFRVEVGQAIYYRINILCKQTSYIKAPKAYSPWKQGRTFLLSTNLGFCTWICDWLKSEEHVTSVQCARRNVIKFWYCSFSHLVYWLCLLLFNLPENCIKYFWVYVIVMVITINK